MKEQLELASKESNETSFVEYFQYKTASFSPAVDPFTRLMIFLS